MKSPVKRDENRIGRNDACPCGSGKKLSSVMALIEFNVMDSCLL